MSNMLKKQIINTLVNALNISLVSGLGVFLGFMQFQENLQESSQESFSLSGNRDDSIQLAQYDGGSYGDYGAYGDYGSYGDYGGYGADGAGAGGYGTYGDYGAAPADTPPAPAPAAEPAVATVPDQAVEEVVQDPVPERNPIASIPVNTDAALTSLFPGGSNTLGRQWNIDIKIDPITDNVIFLYSVRSEITSNNQKPATLVIRTRDGEPEVFVYWGEEIGTTNTVLVRYDKRPSYRDYWNVSTDRKASFNKDPQRFLSEMLSSASIILRVSPVDSIPLTATFDVSGLQNAIYSAEQRARTFN